MANVDIKKLESYKFQDVKKIIKVGVEPLETKKSGKMFVIKYMIHTNKGPRMIGFTSRDKSFKKPIHFIMYSLKLIPGIFIKLKDEFNNDDKFPILIALVTKSKYSIPKKNISENVEFLNERINFGKIIIGAKEWWNNMDDLEKFVWIFNGIMISSPIIIKLVMVGISVSHWIYERYVESAMEQSINKKLFSEQDKNDSRFSIFSNLKNYVSHVTDKQANGLIVYGPPGMSKTYTVRRTLYFEGLKPRREYSIEKGSSLGLQSTYDLLYKNRKRILVLDDFDTPLKDPDIVNLLKACLDTYSKRILTLSKERTFSNPNQQTSVSTSPVKFEYKGQIIIITNLEKDVIDKALMSRAPALRVSYNGKEIIDFTETAIEYICPDIDIELKKEAFEYIIKLYNKNKKIELSFRNIQNAFGARRGNPYGWKEMIHTIVDYKGAILENVSIKNDIEKRSYLSILKESVLNNY